MELGITAFLTDRAMAPADLARAVEARGFASLFLPEHTHLPTAADTPPGLVDGVALDDYKRSLDPLVALASAASVTSRIRLGTGVALPAQHDPIVLAKALATLDHVSGGRTVFGMGFGWNRIEAADHGVEFPLRREVAREHVLAVQALWRDEQAEFQGRFVTFGPCWSFPKPVQEPRIPVLVGGGAFANVFNAIAEYGDGWMPIGGSGVADALPVLRARVEAAGRDPGSIRVVPFGTVPTPAKLEHFRRLGVDEVVLRVPSGPADAMLEVLDAHAGYVDEFGGAGG